MSLPEQFSPRKKPRQGRAQATVSAILEAAAHILAGRGYDAMTTNHVAERAGVSIGSLYQYFPNKESLVAALLQKNADDNLEALEKAMTRARGLPLPQALEITVDAFMRLHASDSIWHRGVMNAAARIGAAEWENRLSDRAFALAREFFAAHVAELRPGLDVSVALIVVREMTSSVLDHALNTDPSKLESPATKAEIVGAILAYVTGEPRQAGAALLPPPIGQTAQPAPARGAW